ncbi:SDR family oxidoreductase [Saccharothrix coeruleofusca]|uniref:Short-chain dehydrogenase/reductase n=1 Tax=Saccharothrix coeruleofusca TaxID=33919 RepID=A0A918AMB8_9PSEU|nr:SDR family oxidoreductase [Saccharothrix coeruleofusca]MBP2339604.1 NAD(P)-dependent dehydrogenase (short-subunit alcohol dehydrogenase family) [Saccharothrix coeruleofusca]GGP56536.1 short-chain dehydrogenase/reductase [Saccharothrix coeruleofusca]
MTRTWFITGTSSGFGRELTEQLLRRGDRVAATARRPHTLDDLAARHGDQLWRAALDITDTTALREVVDRAFAELGRIDVVVSNAGYGLFGAAEELTDEQIDRQIATNLTASIQLARAATPHLRRQGGGRFVQIASVGGQIAFPAMSLYHATKWGIEGFWESAAAELAPFGIDVTIVEPGVSRTNFGAGGSVLGPPLPEYADGPSGQLRRMAAGELPPLPAPGDPAKIAAAIIARADQAGGPLRLTLGSDAYALATDALGNRLRALEAQRELAHSTDADS